MTASATTTFAHRLGSALGTAARFCLYDRNPMVRWIKRAIVLAVLGAVLVNSFSWIASSLLSIGAIGLIGLTLAKGDLAIISSAINDNEDDVPNIPVRGEYEHPDYRIYFKD